MFADVPGKLHRGKFVFGRFTLCDDIQVGDRHLMNVPILNEKATGDLLVFERMVFGLRSLAFDLEDSQVLLRREYLQSGIIVIRGDNDFGEYFDRGAGRRGVDFTVICDDAAECGDRIGRESPLICLFVGGTGTDAGGIGVFDYQAVDNLRSW